VIFSPGQPSATQAQPSPLKRTVIEVIPQLAVPVSVQDHGPTKDNNFLRDNRFLFLAIDLQKPKKDILMEFERHFP
jgi:hypothetical protein